MLADPRARKRGRRTDLAVKRAYYRLADEKREIILVACSKCDWRAAFERDELIAAHGADYAMPNLLNHLAAPDCNRVDSQWDRCDQERCSTASRACTMAAISLATSGRWHRARRSSARSLSSAPILLGFALHGRRIGVFHLEPIGRAAGPIGRVFPLRHDRIRVRGSGGLYTDGPRDLETRLLVRLWRQNCSRSWESIATWPGIVKSFQRDLPSILAHPLGLCLGVFYNGRRQL